ncbi:ADP-heptose:LPS heptosyltransferase [Desulfonatronum thiosulfatophilum]|uniref:ADP-heptose:LPS heptosyltransferase n=1 Tax=Desulfonatronum thiosulfatophilum TaxID=617002 RepID=A0A1G6D2X8_9BACT|nr:glycosyltransferase family 9 protein [Desulfonatronum thiosulfatophilum]SDB39523.1 ADP-heptose:LPS heptosyltransferase [Desulfonatronum thiosulfatophilum]
MNTLVLNLTRFGDLLQTQPVIAGLQDQGRSVGLVCLDNFAGAAQFLKGMDHVFALPGAALLSDLDRGWPHGLERFIRWRHALHLDFPPHSLLNLTPLQSARLLARFLNTDPIGGFGLDEQGFGYYGNSWAAFLQTSTMNRGCSPFNLVDLMLRSADLPVRCRDLDLARPADEVMERIHDILTAKIPDAARSECRGFVALQPGASEPRRQWPWEYFAQLGALLWDNFRMCPVLLGTSGERPLAEGYARHAVAPFIDLVGRTSLPELAAALCHADLLVTNDTGTMHLAAGLHRPIAAIFLATAQPWDTGPYRAGSICLEPKLACHPCAFGTTCSHQEKCRWEITPHHVFQLICDHLLTPQNGGRRPSAASSPGTDATRVRAWLTRRDEHGYLDLKSLSGQEESLRTQWIRIQRHLYRQFLDQCSVIHPPNHAYVLPVAQHDAILASLDQSIALLRILESQVQVLAANPMEKVKQKFLAYWERLQSHWQSDPFFTVLGRLWFTESQDQGHNLTNILHLTRRYLVLTQAWKSMLEKQNNRHEN